MQEQDKVVGGIEEVAAEEAEEEQSDGREGTSDRVCENEIPKIKEPSV